MGAHTELDGGGAPFQLMNAVGGIISYSRMIQVSLEVRVPAGLVTVTIVLPYPFLYPLVLNDAS